MRASLVLAFVIATAVGVRSAASQELSFPASRVHVDIDVRGVTATVAEEYLLTRAPETLTFQFLQPPCSRVGLISAIAGRQPVTFEASHNGPWTLLRAAGTRFGPDDAMSLAVRYDVELAGAEPAVPLVMPAAVLERAPGSRGAHVTLTTRYGGEGREPLVATTSRGEGRESIVVAENAPPQDGPFDAVLLPRLERPQPRAPWHGRLLALPSFVRVRLAPGHVDACTPPPRQDPTGGLVWRFWTFVGTMAVWVPVYFAWLGRRRDDTP